MTPALVLFYPAPVTRPTLLVRRDRPKEVRMPYLAWSDDLDTGIPELDAQHRVMVDHVNRLHDSAAADDTGELLTAMDALIECLRQHFVFEEKVLETIQYAGLAEHSEEHRRIIEKLGEYRKRLETASAPEAEEIVDVLGPWVVDHIRHDDLDFGPTVREWLQDASPPDDPFRQLVGDT
jgi:hemerythrin